MSGPGKLLAGGRSRQPIKDPNSAHEGGLHGISLGALKRLQQRRPRRHRALPWFIFAGIERHVSPCCWIGQRLLHRATGRKDAHKVTVLASEVERTACFWSKLFRTAPITRNASAKAFRLSLANSCEPLSVREEARNCKARRFESSGNFRRLLAKNA